MLCIFEELKEITMKKRMQATIMEVLYTMEFDFSWVAQK